MSLTPYPTLRLKITPLAALQLRMTGLPGVPGPVGPTGPQGPAGSGGGTLADGDKGDITVSGSGAVWTIDNQVVTYAKIQNVSSTARVLGRITVGAGVTEELTGANVKTIVGSGDLTKTDDTNVTLTLGGTPIGALFNATSLTLGWTGSLAVGRGGLGVTSLTAYAVLCGGTTSTGPVQSIGSVGTAGDVLTSNGAGALPTFQAAGAASGTPVSPQGRLTLQTLVPVMTTTQSGKTTLFYTPYAGNVVPIYNGTTFAMTAFTEIQVQTTDTTKSPAAIGASKVNDWFVWNDGGTIRLGHGPDWTNDTTRSAGTALVMVNGILLNNAALTNGPAASRGTYVGTTRSNGSSQLDWIYGTTGSATTGVAGFFGVWNAYNRVDLSSMVGDGTASWAYNTNAWRSVNGSNTNRHSFVCGLSEDGAFAQYTVPATSTGANLQVGIGLDATNALAANCSTGSMFSANILGVLTTLSVPPQLGFHFVQAIETNLAGVATSTYFSNGSAAVYQAGFHFRFRM